MKANSSFPRSPRLSAWEFAVSVIFVVSWVCLPGFRLAAAERPCESLVSLRLRSTTLTLAKLQPAGPFTPPGARAKPVALPAFCRVAGVIKPTTDSAIHFEVWMPVSGWNGRFQQEGNAGFAGAILYPLMAHALRQGYATASTDDGHTGGHPTWAINHPEKVIDFGYRAVHDTAEDSEAIIASFYNRSAFRSYFIGCSDGGREALMEAQRFPSDFDGIMAGAPANDWTHLFAGFVWNEQATLDNPSSYIPVSKLAILQVGALAACDALDGVKDGVIEDPRRCHFDPAELQCKGPDQSGCLTAAQVEAARKIYAGPRNPRTGRQIFPGYEPGAEAAQGDWSTWITGKTPGKSYQIFFGNSFFADMVFQNSGWDFRTFNFDSDMRLADSKVGSILNSTNPDLAAFKAHGGKLIQYHGWADSAIAPLESINYYDRVIRTARGQSSRSPQAALRATQDFYRLFMVPGMGHCGGGTGPTTFGGAFQVQAPQVDAKHDMIKALQQWVEHGVAPKEIIATKYVNNKPTKGIARTWLLCPYPQEAKWTGKGNPQDEANYVCTLPGKDGK
ncbi:MAG: tannase/feruloyl esterase family alpha/beta hydrolase [Acidobacteria bacterium]|nr:tannase/feruloyl esterase family alpha/beta hydrolase [Acidobacteriota bacterium]